MPAPKNPEPNGHDPDKKPDKPKPKRPNTASVKRPPTAVDQAISKTIDDLRVSHLNDIPRQDLARRAGHSDHHALRLFRTPRSGPGAGTVQPRQSWTVNELLDYSRALGMTAGGVLSAAGVEPARSGAEEAILADPALTPSAKGSLLTMLQALRAQG
jgi:hypothetical protein